MMSKRQGCLRNSQSGLAAFREWDGPRRAQRERIEGEYEGVGRGLGLQEGKQGRTGKEEMSSFKKQGGAVSKDGTGSAKYFLTDGHARSRPEVRV